MTSAPRLGIPLVLTCFLLPLPLLAQDAPARTAPGAGDQRPEQEVANLVKALQDDNALVRKRAAIALGRLGPAAQSAAPALEKAMRDSDPDVRTAAAAALLKVDVRASLDDLVHRLRDPAASEQARREACRELAERFWKEPRAAQALEAALTDPAVKLAAAQALDEIDRHAPATPQAPPQATPRSVVAAHTALVRGLPNLLLRRPEGQPDWQRVAAVDGLVSEGDALLALPGYRSQVNFANGVGLLLWGNLVDFLDVPLLESAVELHRGPGVDLAFTLERGRVVVTNEKKAGPVTVRVQFGGTPDRPAQTWEVTLQEPGTEVVMDLMGRYPQGTGFSVQNPQPPRAEFYLVLLRGDASVKAEGASYELRPPPGGPSLMAWDNAGGGVQPPKRAEGDLHFWNKALPQTPAAEAAQESLNLILKQPADRPVRTVLEETLHSDRPVSRNLAVFCLGAIDDLGPILDVLDSSAGRDETIRQVAVFELRHWIGERADHDRLLYQLLMASKGYTANQAETFLTMLHDFGSDQLREPTFWQTLISYLRADKPAIRTLAYWHLYRLVPQGREPKFDPSGDAKQREAAYEAWKKLIPDGALPPAQQPRKQPPG